MTTNDQIPDDDFIKRRDEARHKINAMDKDVLHNQPERQSFFNAVYQQAKGDPAFVPWADLKEKNQLSQWLNKNTRINSSTIPTAMDVACGLGDNAEALSKAGYKTTAFDLAEEAINWTRARFPDSSVNYQRADLFKLPGQWINAFDLVHECYTLQALPEEMFGKTAKAIALMVKQGGTLLVFTRVRKDGTPHEGPPWPLQEKNTTIFSQLGFDLVANNYFENKKNERIIPHRFMEWRKQ